MPTRIARRLRALLCVAAIAVAPGAEYLVAPGGEDAGGGSADHPFATLHQALTRARSGDVVHVACGGTYRETGITFPAGVTVIAAGREDAPIPVVTASQVVPELKPWKDHPAVLTVAVARRVLECYVDGQFIPLARYPNEGWLRAGAGSTPDRLVVPDREKLPGAKPGRWQGAEVRWRRWSWWWETRPITTDDGVGALTLGADGRFGDPFVGVGSAFCIDNCLAELDAPGEWCWDATSGQLYVYPPADAAATPTVEVVIDGGGCTCAGATLHGLAFSRFAGSALGVARPSRIEACSFEDIGDTAIAGSYDAAGTTVVGCSFTDVRNVAIAWTENPQGPGGTVFERNRLERIGMRFGYGGSGSWHGAGIIVYGGKAVTTRLNRIRDTGYAGIILGGDGMVVERNVFTRCMGSLNDGAAIYANCSRSVITENIVLDTIGNLDTSMPWYPLGHGIWCEFLKDYREQRIVGNTVVGSGGNGIFLTNNYACEVRENVLVGNRLADLHLSGEKGPQDHRIAGNVLGVVEPSRRIIGLVEHIPGDWHGNDHPRAITGEGTASFGAMSGTKIIASPGSAVIETLGKRFDDPAAWAQACAWGDAQARIVRATTLVLINDTEQPHDFPAPAGGGWVDVGGKAVASTVTVAPFRSAVLAKGEAVDGLPEYVLASDADAQRSNREVAKRHSAKPTAKLAKPAAGEGDAPARRSAEPVARPNIWADEVATLRERTRVAAAAGRGPRFHAESLKSDVTIQAIDGDRATVAISGGGALTVDLFARLTDREAAQIAADLVHGEDPAGHALAAFFARCAHDVPAFEDHIARAGAAGDLIRRAFEKP